MKIHFAIVGMILVFKLGAQSPAVLVMNADRLLEMKKNVQQKDQEAMRLIDSLKKQADAFLSMKPVSVM
jgi:hypothetical protein